MANDEKIVKLVVNYDSNENKDEPKTSNNVQWYLRVLKAPGGWGSTAIYGLYRYVPL